MTAVPIPSVQDFVDQARHNEEFLSHLVESVLPERPDYSDWALVVAFYAALHYTKAAILRDHGEVVAQHRSHYDRMGHRRVGHNDLVREHLAAIKTSYRDLFDLGHEARYRAYFKQPGDAVAEVKRQQRVLVDIKLACGY